MAEDAPAARYAAPFEAQYDPARAQDYMVQRLIRQIHTATLVKVLAVYPTADKVGFVDVQPLVQDVDTIGRPLAQSPIFKIPYLRLQGGLSAVILDPAVGDLGLAVFAERDMTGAVATKAEGAPATARAYSSADGFYFGGFLNADPKQWLKFVSAGGIEIVSTGDITLKAPGNMTLTAGGNLTLNITGNVKVAAASTTWAGPVTFSGAVTMPAGATISNIPFATHKHVGVSSGSGTSGTPVP